MSLLSRGFGGALGGFLWACWCLQAGVAGAEVTAVSGEFRVNTFTVDFQRYPDVAMDADGGFVVVWASYAQDGDYGGIFGQMYDELGTPLRSEFQANATAYEDQYFPAVASAGDGSFVVVWTSYYQDGDDSGVFAQRFDSENNPVGGEFQVNTFSDYYQGAPAVAADADGNFVVAWMSDIQDGDDFGIFAQRYDQDGIPIGSEFQVNTVSDDYQGGPAVSMDAGGDFVVAWSSFGQDGDGYGTMARRFASDGTPLSDEIALNSSTEADQLFPSLAMLTGGDFVAAWMSDEQDGDGFGIASRYFQASGNALGPESLVNQTTDLDQSLPDVAANAGGGVVVWASDDQDGDLLGIYGRQLDSAGLPSGDELAVNTFVASDQTNPAVAMDPQGGVVVTWTSESQDGDGFGVYARLFTSQPPAASCAGDCSGDGAVTVNELIVGVNIALGSTPVSECTAFDQDADGEVTVSELIRAVNAALDGCPPA